MERPDDPVRAPALAATLASLGPRPRDALERLRTLGFRAVQLSALQDGLRPRELDRSARRDLGATLRRRDLGVSGIDLWIPSSHFHDDASVDRAVAAVQEAITLAADLGGVPVCLTLPARADDDVGEDGIAAVVAFGQTHGVTLADHALTTGARPGVGVGIDPAAYLADGSDPAAAAVAAGSRLASARLCDLLASGMRGPVGAGADARLDVMAYRVSVETAGVVTPVVVDARQWTDPWAGLAQSVLAWRAAGLG